MHKRSYTMQLATIILGILKTRRGKVHRQELVRLVRYHFERRGMKGIPDFEEINHSIDLLVDDGHIIKTHNGAWDEFQLSTKGYARLKAWHATKKVLFVISNDFAKLLSIVATVLSILATYLSIKARY